MSHGDVSLDFLHRFHYLTEKRRQVYRECIGAVTRSILELVLNLFSLSCLSN